MSNPQRIFLAYFGAITFAVAGPVYSFILPAHQVFGIDRLEGLWLVLVVSVIPALVLALVRGRIKSLARILDVTLYSAAALSLFRQVQLHWISTYSWDATSRIGAILLALVCAGALIWLSRRYVTMYMTFLGALSVTLPAHFLWALPQGPPEVATVNAQTTDQSDHPANTVFVFVFDELSLEILLDETGKVDRQAFPSFAEFASESVWFRQAMANYPLTTFSIDSMLTGAFVRQGIRDVTRLPEPNLLSVLHSDGYKVGFYSLTLSCTTGAFECIRLSPGTFGTTARSLKAAGRYFIPEAVQFLLVPALGRAPRLDEARALPTLGDGVYAQPGRASFFHFMITHYPYVLSADGGPTSFADYLGADFRPGVDVSRTLPLYRNQARFLDRQFGGFLQTLKRSGAWERSIVLVTADHGACWKPGCMPRYGRLTAVEPSLARVPMMIRAPLLAPRVVDDDYQHVDLYPTLLQVLGVMPGGLGVRDGRAALDPPLRTRRRLFFANGTDHSVDLGIPLRRVEVANP